MPRSITLPHEVIEQLPAGVTATQIREHVIAPKHVRDVRIEQTDEALEKRARVVIKPKVFRTKPKVDLESFGLTIHTVLKDRVAGYMLRVNENGVPVHIGIWNWAQTPANKGLGWNENTTMHVASVSKLLTAIGMVKLLQEKNIAYEATMSANLPAYWTRGAHVDEITYRHLLTHRTGFDVPGSATNFSTMKSEVAAGVATVGTYQYENMNFALCRLLIPIINGDISRDATFFDPVNDQVWDVLTINHYNNYMQTNVFGPAGASATFSPPSGKQNALAYDFPFGSAKGWNSGDLATVCGGAGWRISAADLLKVMHHARRKNTIISTSAAQQMLDSSFGIDQIQDTEGGKLYNKNGAWGNGVGTEQCVAHFFPDNMECVLFVNSPIGTEEFSLRGLVHDAFVGSLSS